MAVLDASNAQSENDFQNDRQPPIPAGMYHVAVNHAAEEGSKIQGTPGVAFEVQIICDGITEYKKVFDKKKGILVRIEKGIPTTGQGSKTRAEFFTSVGKTDEMTKKMLANQARLAMACGILLPGEKKEVDWDQAIGRELIVEFTNERKEVEEGGKKIWKETGYTKIDWFSFWSIGNPAVANVPKDKTTPGMQQLAKTGGNGNGAGTAIPKAPAATAAPATKSKFSDL
jgi:hypothetical protein